MLPPAAGGSRRRGKLGFGEKPKLYDAWLQPGDDKWEYIMPVSAQIKPKTSSDLNTPKTIDAASLTTSTNTLPLRSPFTRWTRPSALSSRDQSPSPASNGSGPIIGQEDDRVVQVSVLIAMPSPTPIAKWDTSEDAGVPDVVVGVAQLPFQPGNPLVDDETVPGGQD
jgi:hypothetical protein